VSHGSRRFQKSASAGAAGRHPRAEDAGEPACYACVDARINSTISPRFGVRRSARKEKIVLPSTNTSSTPGPAKLILGVRFNSFLISRLRRPASNRMPSQVKQRLISMVKDPPFRRHTAGANRHPISVSVCGHGFAFALGTPVTGWNATAGYSNFDYLARDSDLKTLRGEPEGEVLVERMARDAQPY
jgi:hypothetical protein